MNPATSNTVTTAARDTFYAAAVAGLRALDAAETSPRRFGRDADARWTSFKGTLTDADRIDLLLRDAAVTWGTAFSPAESFALFGLAPDEPFGPDWKSLTPTTARRHLDAPAAPLTPTELAALIDIRPTPVEIPTISPSTRLIIAGGSALIAVANAFAAQQGLSWSDQVLVVATTPAHRQLAGLLALFTGSSARTRLCTPGDDLRAILKTAGFAQVDVAVVSPDAEPPCAEFARRAAGVV